MTYPSCDYATPDDLLTVNYHFDADTMTIYPVDHPSVAAFLNGGGVIAAYITPEPASTPAPHLNSGGLARFSGAAPVSVLEVIRMQGVTRVSKGRYRAYHETPMPTDQYSAIPAVFDANPRVPRITARTDTYVEVRVTDLAGVAQDPAEVTIQTQRVIVP